MKKAAISIFISLILLIGCDQNTDNSLDQSVADSSKVLAIEAEIVHPESALTDTSETISYAKPKFKHDWQDMYYQKLMEYCDNPTVMFNIYDLNGDGTPELLLSEGGYHAAGGTLYTVQREELICLGGYGSWGEFQYDFERNYLHSSYFQLGSGFLTVYGFENGEISKIVSFYSYDGSFPSPREEEYTINDEKAPEDVFNAEYETYSFDIREEFTVRKYDATQNMIESVLNEFQCS